MSEQQTVGMLVDNVAEEYPEQSIVFPTERETYRDLATNSLAAAVALQRLGVGPGDAVGVLAHAGLPVVELIIATARLGAVVVPINTRFKAAELAYLVDNADLRVLIAGPDFLGMLGEALPSLGDARPGRMSLPEAPTLRHVATLGGIHMTAIEDWPALLAAAARAEEGERTAIIEAQADIWPDDPVLVMYTSGTTSRPRGCVHSHSTLLHQGAALAIQLRLGPDDRFWTPLPFFHVGGFDVLFAALWSGAGTHHSGIFDPGTALRQLAGDRCTVAFPAFETIWLAVLGHPDFAGTDLSALRVVINVGTPERMRSMQAQVPQAIQISCTGSTESAGFCCVGSIDDPAETRATTSGPVVEGVDGKIIDPETGADVPDGTLGEFLVRGTVRFLRYHRDPVLTAERIDADGWYHTGDGLIRDPDGRFIFVTRLADRLKVGGENVAAAELEDLLARHPSAGIVQVVAAPDAYYGEVPAAFVQLRPGATATEAELIDFCRERIAGFKVPRYVHFVDEWPMSGTKIQKYRLRERIATDLADRGITEAPRVSSRPAVT